MSKHRTGHLFRRGKSFYVRWTIEGKVFSKSLRDDHGNRITTRREAEDAQAKLMAPYVVADETTALESIAGKLAGRKAELAKWEDEQNPPAPISTAWNQFLASSNRPDSGEATLRQYGFQWTAFEDWMKKKRGESATLRDVTKEIAEEYAGQLNHGRLSASTCNKHLNLLTLVFRVLKHRSKLIINPWEDIQRKRVVAHSRRELTVEELRKICKSASGELRLLLALGVYSGLRLGDCATLRWCEVDLPRGIIRRIPNKTARRNPKPVILPIHTSLLELLAAAPANQRGEFVLPEMCSLYQKRADLVTDRVQRHFGSCGITLHKSGTGEKGKRAILEVGFHSLRHTFVSLCRDSNAPLAVVESMVGHSSPSMTRHYTHVGELAAGRAVAALPGILGDPDSKQDDLSDQDRFRSEVRRLIKSMNTKNWKTKRKELLAILRAEPSRKPVHA